MKNGISIGIISELADEVRKNSREAEYTYRVSVSWTVESGMIARSRAATLGTITVARNFSLKIAEEATPNHLKIFSGSMLSAEQLAMAGLGGCILTTYVFGCSAKNIPITSAHLQINYNIINSSSNNSPNSQISDIGYMLNLRAEGLTDEILEIAEASSTHSPNYRTVVEANHINWSLSEDNLEPDYNFSYREPKLIINNDEGKPFPSFSIFPEHSRLLLRWDYGVQMSILTTPASFGSTAFQIDQAKQLGGIDKGLNPQEYSLMGLGSSLLQIFLKLAKQNHYSIQRANLLVEGLVDIRGLLGVDSKTPTQVQDINCTLFVDGKEELDTYNELLRQALEKSSVSDLITQPHSISRYIQHTTSSEKIVPC